MLKNNWEGHAFTLLAAPQHCGIMCEVSLQSLCYHTLLSSGCMCALTHKRGDDIYPPTWQTGIVSEAALTEHNWVRSNDSIGAWQEPKEHSWASYLAVVGRNVGSNKVDSVLCRQLTIDDDEHSPTIGPGKAAHHSTVFYINGDIHYMLIDVHSNGPSSACEDMPGQCLLRGEECGGGQGTVVDELTVKQLHLRWVIVVGRVALIG